MKSGLIEELAWDTNLFEYKVGQLKFDSTYKISERAILKEAEKFKVVYIVSDEEITKGDDKFKLVDIKTTLVKKGLKKQVDFSAMSNVCCCCCEKKRN